MARRVFLHIGTMKSATTYLQDLCQLNKSQLGAAGIWWPGKARNFIATEGVLAGSGSERGQIGAWRKLAAEARAFDGDVLISNELICGRPRRRLRRLVNELGPADVQVIVTARDLGRVIPSQWQTMSRNRSTVAWTEYVEAATAGPNAAGEVGQRFWRRHDLPEIVTTWSGLVPPGHITVVTVPPVGSDPALIGERFTGVVSDGLSGLKQPPYRNVSLGAHSAELMRRLNLQTTDWELPRYRRAFKNAVGSWALEERATLEPRLGLSTRQLERAHELAEAMVGELDVLDVRVVGDLNDLLPAASQRPSQVDPGETSDAELLAAASHALLNVAGQYADLQLKHERSNSATDRRAGSRPLMARAKGLAKRIPGLPGAVESSRSR